MIRSVVTVLGFALPGLALAQDQAPDEALAHSVEQLRSAVGRWDVETEFLRPDGSVARTVDGVYEFSWVVPNRVLVGRNEIPSMSQASGILFYIKEAQREVEMVSVGGDGRLWIMTGPLGGEVRWSQEYQTPNGATRQLRFTRYNVSADAFESRMEYTTDGGSTWRPGNHQQFRRAGTGDR